jgi:acylglycerol lipase
MGASESKPCPEFDDNQYTGAFKGATLSESIVVLNGRRINVTRWTPENKPKGIVFVAHGLHDNGLRYCCLASVLAPADYLVVAMDHTAHGLSEGTRGLITDYKMLPMDFAALCKSVHEEHPALPTFIVSHSMGTLVTALAIKDLPFVKAVVFVGCALISGPGASSLLGIQALYPLSQTFLAPHITQLLASVSPKGNAAPIVFDAITSWEHGREILLKDSRRYDGEIMNKTAYELIKCIIEVKKELPNIKVPFMCLHGSADTICLPKGSEYMMKNTGTDKDQKSYVILPDLMHDVFNEIPPHGNDAMVRVLNYFDAQK